MKRSPFRSVVASVTAVSMFASMVPYGVRTAAASPAVNINAVALGNTGTSQCGGPNQAFCTLESATYLRPWDSKSDCPSGSFFDAFTYGGSCWECPSGYTRSATPVTADDACWSPAHPIYSEATWHAQRAFAWDCPTDTFWDGWNTDEDKANGACYTCDSKVEGSETVTMIRNVSPIWQDDACWGSTSHQTSRATLKQLNGCVSNTTGKEVPDGKPFRDPTNYDGDPSSASSTETGTVGTCWTCPQFSQRTVFPVWSGNACDTVFKWQSPTYPEPGLFAFDGATDIMAEILEHPQDVTDAIFHAALQLDIPPSEIVAYVQATWSEIGNTPARSALLNGLVLLRLMQNVGVYSQLPAFSPEKFLIDDVALYVKNRRTFVAADALHMYDVWKQGEDYWVQQNGTPIAGAFFIGNAPPDFRRQAEDNWMELGTLSLTALGTGGGLASGLLIDSLFPNPTFPIQATRGYAPNISSIPRPFYKDAVQPLAHAYSRSSLIQAGATATRAAVIVGSTMAGAAIISAVGAALISISIDQFIKSQVARPELVESLTAAQENVDLSEFIEEDAFGTYWALGTAEPTDPAGIPLIEKQCHGFLTTPGSLVQMAPCAGYIKVAQAAKTALMTAGSQSYLPSFPTTPTISFTAPTSNPFYSMTDNVLLSVRATDPMFGVPFLFCVDGATLPQMIPVPITDGLDGITVLMGEGTHTVTCGAINNLGLATPAPLRPSTTVVIDQTRPVLTASYLPAQNADGWNKSDVSVSFGCTDALSGVATNTAAAAQLVTTEGSTQVSSSTKGSCTDKVGHTALAVTAPVKLDKTLPTFSGSGNPAPNPAGWNNSAVTVTFTCADTLSGIASCPLGTTLSANGRNIHVVGDVVDKAGNVAQALHGPLNIDVTPPNLSAMPSVAPNGNGWNSTDVTFTFSCSDSPSGVASCPSSQTFGEGASQMVAGTAHDVAGNSKSLAALSVSIDKTAPTITGGRNPAQGNAHGWNNSDVTVAFACNDALSGIDPNAGCTTPQMVAEGANQSVTGTAKDKAGNQAAATVGAINVDKTPPVVTVTGVSSSAVYVRGKVPAAACNTTDALSGVLTNATPAVTGGNAHAVGSYQARCTGASDKAGNTRSAVAAGYQVVYPFTPSVWPLRNAGNIAPMKFSLGGDYGLNVLASGSPRSQRVSCLTGATIGAATATAGTLTFDRIAKQYVYSWKTDRNWQGTCRRFMLSLDDGTTHPVSFVFL